MQMVRARLKLQIQQLADEVQDGFKCGREEAPRMPRVLATATAQLDSRRGVRRHVESQCKLKRELASVRGQRTGLKLVALPVGTYHEWVPVH